MDFPWVACDSTMETIRELLDSDCYEELPNEAHRQIWISIVLVVVALRTDPHGSLGDHDISLSG